MCCLLLVPVPKYWKNFRQGFFAISGIPVKTVVNKNCHNLRSNSEIDIKLGPLCKIIQRNSMTSTKIRQ